MANSLKPKTRTGYPPGQRAILRATCLELGRALPADLCEHLTLIGGVVPSLRVAEVADDPHPGSFDLDFGVELGVGDRRILTELEHHLRGAGFGPYPRDRTTRDAWQFPAGSDHPKITIDLILRGDPDETWLPEIEFAFRDRDKIRVTGEDFAGRPAMADLWVCGLASFVLLKGLAFSRRGEEKDAFDLYWSLRHWPNAWNEVAYRMAPFLSDRRARQILDRLADDFDEDARGARAVARFVSGHDDDDLAADATGLVLRMLGVIGYP